jgi:hypothetical protein
MALTPEQFAAKLKSAREMLERKRVEFHRFGANIAYEERKKGMDRGESPTGEKFQPLKPATIKRKKNVHATQRMYRKTKGGPSGLSKRRAKPSTTPEKPLIDTGVMRNPTVEADARSGRVVMAKSRSEIVSAAGSIGNIHQKGAGNNPKRVHWGFYKPAIHRIENAYGKMIGEIVRSLSG